MSRRRTANIQRRPRVAEQPAGRLGPLRRRGDVRLIVAAALLLFTVIGVVVFVVATSRSDAVGQVVPNAGQGHIDDGTSPPPGTYSSTPGTSGPHWNSPAAWRNYPAPVAEAQVIHNLEHGGIVIWYDTDRISPEDRTDLTAFVEDQLAGERFKFILSPWGGADFGHAIAVTAWTRLLYQDELDLAEIREFVDRYYERLGPEPAGGPAAPG